MNLSSLIKHFAGPLLALSVVALFALVGTIERWGLDFDDTRNEQRATSHSHPAETDCRLATARCINHHRVTVDLAGCTPPSWIRVNSVVELTIRSTSDLGWTVVGCTRFAHALAKPLPVSLVLTKTNGVNRE